MKNTITLFTAMITVAIFTIVACKKSKSPDPAPTPSVCNGKNLCFKLNGTSESHDAKWKVIRAGRNRILWEEGSGSSYKNIEMDIYSDTKGKYDVVANPSAGKAGFQYYIQSDNKNIQGQSGTIEITDIGATISGNFKVTAKDATGTTYEIIEGQFVNVPK